MSTCLGLYIEDHLIKYAKISKDNDIIKVDSFGIKFFDKLNDAIKQVIEETYSYKIPISVNLSNETHHYFYLFSLLNKKDMQNVINTEFESICYDNGFNKEAFETRYVLVDDLEDKEKVKAIHISANKTDLAKKEQQLEGYHIIAEAPMGIAIGNLLEYRDKENIMIVNIESKTTVTIIIDKKIVDIQVIEEGTSSILNTISTKENSNLKAYEICKNTTIYTQEGRDLQYEENEYLEDIMPTLYNIVGTVQKITDQSLNRIDKIYITGTASVINNIDIYFQEYLRDIKCEILKPYFINNLHTKINIKDYIEVNSAIALALQGLGDGIKGINFKKESFRDKLPDWLTADIGGKSKKIDSNKENKARNKPKLNIKFDMDFKSALTAGEKNLIRIATGLLVLILVYMGISVFLYSSLNKKSQEIDQATKEVNTQIANINHDATKIKTNTSKYISMTEKLEQLATKTQEKNKRKNAIPTLLNQIMFSIPKDVQITSIENTSGNNIVITAQAPTYEQLGYLKSKIKEDGILLNVVSDSAQKQGQESLVITVIEGILPIE